VQIGSPLEVYWNPADTFVARFLGSPPMNLLELPASTAASGIDDWLRAGNENATAPLTLWHPATLAPYSGRQLIVGVRAEDLRLGPPAEATPTGRFGWLRGRIDAIEPLGAETLVLVSANGTEVTARLGRDVPARVGDAVTLSFDAVAVHLFDPVTTKAIAKER
jgi:multiple sugar transport system ATP-binding protein